MRYIRKMQFIAIWADPIRKLSETKKKQKRLLFLWLSCFMVRKRRGVSLLYCGKEVSNGGESDPKRHDQYGWFCNPLCLDRILTSS